MVKNHRLVRIALVAALLCVLSPVTLPLGPVPITLATLGVYFAAALLRPLEATAAVGIYMLLGGIGMPVFAGFAGGPERLFGLTGGYILGYIPCCLVAALLCRIGPGRRWLALGLVGGTVLLYAVGTLWYMGQMACGPLTALAVCVLPFLPGDGAKILLACGVLPPLRRSLEKG